MTQYTMTLDAEQTINGDPVALFINGRQALPTHVIAAETYGNGTVYVTCENALRKIADFRRKVGTIYFNGTWFFFRDGELTPCASAESAIRLGTQLAQSSPTPAPEEETDGRCTECGSDDWSVGASGLCRGCTIQVASPIVARLRLATIGITSAALLALTAATTHAAPAPHYPDVPRHCHIVGTTNPADEGFPIAKCRNGQYLYADMDGNGKNARTNGRWLDASVYVSYGIHPLEGKRHHPNAR